MTINRRSLLAGGAAGALAALGSAALLQEPALAAATIDRTSPLDAGTDHLRSVAAVTQVYGAGQKLTHLVLRYDAEVSGNRLSTSTYQVADRTITKVWTAAKADINPEHQADTGRHVVLELSLDDAAALLWVQLPSTGDGPGAGGPVVGDTTASHKVVPASASVTQVEAVYTARGVRYAPSATPVMNTATRNLIVDDFRQYTYTDDATGRVLPYNLYLPKGYDRRRSYPLVLFMHDASVINAGPLAPLVQGVGATVWASPQDQARHECVVVAPAYPAIVIDDDYQPSTYFDATVNFVKWLTTRYSIDPTKLHATGQSMGAMMSLGMNIRHPDMFASSYIVAGQWPADQADPLAEKKMWVCVSQGDTKAYPGINAIVDEIEPLGAEVTTATWDGQATQSQFRADVTAMESAHANFNFASFTPGTLPGTGSGGNGGSEHMGTWQVAYNIPGVRDWILNHAR
ncbi:alpha/beta hydrolase-fold protein [Streptomyces sp. NPDC059373]